MLAYLDVACVLLEAVLELAAITRRHGLSKFAAPLTYVSTLSARTRSAQHLLR